MPRRGKIKNAPRHCRGGFGPRHGASRTGHILQARPIGQQLQHQPAHVPHADFVLGNQTGCPGLNQRLGIMRLMIVRGMGEGNQHSGLSGRRQFGHRSGPRPAERQISPSIRCSHVIDKGRYF